MRACARFLAVWWCGLGLTLAVHAQPTSQAQGNALMQLMLSQPPVDLNSPATARVVFDPPVIALGEKAVYRITINALETSVQWPQQISVPPGLKMTPAAHGQFLQPLGNLYRPISIFNFEVRPERPGFYSIPGFVLQVNDKPVVVSGLGLEVAATLEPGHERSRELILEPSRTNVYVGEPFRVRVLSPTAISNVVEGLTQIQFNGDGFLDEKRIYRQQVDTVTVGDRRVQAWITEAGLIPLSAGRQTLSVQAFTGGMQILGPVVLSGQVTMLGGAQQPLLLESGPVTINVRPLPPENAQPGFTGYIGSLAVETPQLNTNRLRIGDALRLLVVFRSEGDLGRLTPPPAPRVAGWQAFPPAPAEVPPRLGVAPNSAVAYAYSLIPLTEEVRQTPAIPFSSFDPARGAYVDLTIPAQSVTVTADGLPTDWKPVDWSAAARAENKISLSPLATQPGRTMNQLVPLQMRRGFLWLQAAPAFALFGLWWWDRRRRFLEAHPEVVRRRAARRALRREKRALRQAVARGDGTEFARRAVAALRIAAAPHFPAEPRALVCGEVLSLFEAVDRGGRAGEVIRSLFSQQERASYAAQPANEGPLFSLRLDLERVLEKLEARL